MSRSIQDLGCCQLDEPYACAKSCIKRGCIDGIHHFNWYDSPYMCTCLTSDKSFPTYLPHYPATR